MVGAKLIGGWVALALALALLALASPVAGADSAPGVAVAFELQGTHGYHLSVLGGAKRGETRGEATIFVAKPHSSAIYTAPATFTATTIEVDLGSLGKISLQAEPSGEMRVARSKCDKRNSLEYEPITYVGEFLFRGEEGYTEARATSLPSLVQPFLDLLCSTITEGKLGGPELPGAGLHIGSRGRSPNLQLLARTNGPAKAVRLSASVHEQRGEIEIDRSVGGYFPHRIFDYDPRLSQAKLEPPAPFSGRGVFRRSAALVNRWTGSLRIDFPGRSDLQATGNRFRAVLRHGEWQGPKIVRQRLRLAAPTLPLWPSTKP